MVGPGVQNVKVAGMSHDHRMELPRTPVPGSSAHPVDDRGKQNTSMAKLNKPSALELEVFGWVAREQMTGLSYARARHRLHLPLRLRVLAEIDNLWRFF